jgi:hypothetical protein
MPNGRCRMHGGKSPGAPKGNQNAFKHGRYMKSPANCRRPDGAKSEHHIGRWLCAESHGQVEAITAGPLSQPVARYPGPTQSR